MTAVPTNTTRFIMKHLNVRYQRILILLSLVFAFAHVAIAADDDALLDHPGYVDFSELQFLSGDEPIVEVNLKSPLLSMLAGFASHEDPEAGEIISSLEKVIVRVFDSSAHDANQIADAIARTADSLSSNGWEQIVRVRDGDDNVDVYFKTSPDASMIHGITVMVMEPAETVLINVIGEINANDIAMLGDRLDIAHLQNVDGCQINQAAC